jgi:hypothetical protein
MLAFARLFIAAIAGVSAGHSPTCFQQFAPALIAASGETL